MKKWFMFGLTLLISFTLIACGAEETTTTLSMEQAGVTMVVTLKAEGDRVTEQTADNEIMYDALGVSTAEEAEEFFAGFVEGFDETEGVTHNIEYQEDKVVESLTVDYEKADIDEVSQLAGSQYEAESGDEISLERTIEMLEEQGFEIVE
ncbi:YehR family lipoprotein [Oceanobacillus luteolus]|uniref:YehR family lipoprotein n=1 Tax=Oceanobacillus luteolus TaxID=1274358 RepID=A0ABW4HS95_9BACI